MGLADGRGGEVDGEHSEKFEDWKMKVKRSRCSAETSL